MQEGLDNLINSLDSKTSKILEQQCQKFTSAINNLNNATLIPYTIPSSTVRQVQEAASRVFQQAALLASKPVSVASKPTQVEQNIYP